MAKPMSRQRKWQLKKLGQGMCILCGQPLATAQHCLPCAIKHRDRQHKRNGSKKRLNSLTYRLAKLSNETRH